MVESRLLTSHQSSKSVFAYKSGATLTRKIPIKNVRVFRAQSTCLSINSTIAHSKKNDIIASPYSILCK